MPPDLHVIIKAQIPLNEIFIPESHSNARRRAAVRLAALYRGDETEPRLHIAVDGGFAPVDELAAASAASRPDLAGLRDVGALYAQGEDAVAALRELAAG